MSQAFLGFAHPLLSFLPSAHQPSLLLFRCGLSGLREPSYASSSSYSQSQHHSCPGTCLTCQPAKEGNTEWNICWSVMEVGRAWEYFHISTIGFNLLSCGSPLSEACRLSPRVFIPSHRKTLFHTWDAATCSQFRTAFSSMLLLQDAAAPGSRARVLLQLGTGRANGGEE